MVQQLTEPQVAPPPDATATPAVPRRRNGALSSLAFPALLGVVVLTLWEVGVAVFETPVYVLPSPSTIAASFAGEMSELLVHTRATLTAAVLGYLAGNGFAVLLAAFMAEFRPAETALYPWVLAFRALPVIALAPLLIIWLGFTIWPIVCVAALICFFPTLVNGIEGFKSTDTTTLQLMRGLNASRWETFWFVKVPNALPLLFAAFKISVASALVGAVVGEWISSKEGLGYLTIVASNYVDTLLLFRAIVMVALIAVVWFMLIQAVESAVLSWRRVGR